MNKVKFGTVEGHKGKDELTDSIREFKEDMELQLELYEIVAEARKKYFDELVKQGFTEGQALEIVKVTNI